MNKVSLRKMLLIGAIPFMLTACDTNSRQNRAESTNGIELPEAKKKQIVALQKEMKKTTEKVIKAITVHVNKFEYARFYGDPMEVQIHSDDALVANNPDFRVLIGKQGIGFYNDEYRINLFRDAVEPFEIDRNFVRQIFHHDKIVYDIDYPLATPLSKEELEKINGVVNICLEKIVDLFQKTYGMPNVDVDFSKNANLGNPR